MRYDGSVRVLGCIDLRTLREESDGQEMTDTTRRVQHHVLCVPLATALAAGRQERSPHPGHPEKPLLCHAPKCRPNQSRTLHSTALIPHHSEERDAGPQVRLAGQCAVSALAAIACC